MTRGPFGNQSTIGWPIGWPEDFWVTHWVTRGPFGDDIAIGWLFAMGNHSDTGWPIGHPELPNKMFILMFFPIITPSVAPSFFPPLSPALHPSFFPSKFKPFHPCPTLLFSPLFLHLRPLLSITPPPSISELNYSWINCQLNWLIINRQNMHLPKIFCFNIIRAYWCCNTFYTCGTFSVR